MCRAGPPDHLQNYYDRCRSHGQSHLDRLQNTEGMMSALAWMDHCALVQGWALQRHCAFQQMYAYFNASLVWIKIKGKDERVYKCSYNYFLPGSVMDISHWKIVCKSHKCGVAEASKGFWGCTFGMAQQAVVYVHFQAWAWIQLHLCTGAGLHAHNQSCKHLFGMKGREKGD